MWHVVVDGGTERGLGGSPALASPVHHSPVRVVILGHEALLRHAVILVVPAVAGRGLPVHRGHH